MEEEKFTTPFGEIVHTKDDMNDVWSFTMQMTAEWMDRRRRGIDDFAELREFWDKRRKMEDPGSEVCDEEIRRIIRRIKNEE